MKWWELGGGSWVAGAGWRELGGGSWVVGAGWRELGGGSWGRALWEVAMAQAKERRREGKERGKGPEQRSGVAEGKPAPSPRPSPREKGERGKRARHEKSEKPGPPGKVQCEVCGIQMDDVPGTLAAHCKGKRHPHAESAVSLVSATTRQPGLLGQRLRVARHQEQLGC